LVQQVSFEIRISASVKNRINHYELLGDTVGFLLLASTIYNMPSKESMKWVNTLSVLAVVGSALYVLYVSFNISTTAVFGFENGLVPVAVCQLFAGISIWLNKPTLGLLMESE
jgi:hypothetical protein